MRTPEEKLAILHDYLLSKYPENQRAMDAQEKVNLKNSLLKITYPYSLKNILVFVNEETTNLLASSHHPLLNGLGKKCKQFYTSDSLNPFVQPETGIVVAKRGGISVSWKLWDLDYSFTGQGVWDLSKNAWRHTPNSSATSSGVANGWAPAETVFPYIVQGLGYLPSDAYGMYNAKFTETAPIKLMSPLHIAALIEDKESIEHLLSKGAGTCHGEQKEIMDFILEKERSFAMFDKLINTSLIITDELLKAALKLDSNLHDYLNLKRSLYVQSKIKQEGSFKALQTFLNYSPIPIKSLVEVIHSEPEIMHQLQEGNTLLHQSIIAKEITKVSALLEAIFQAGLSKKIGDFIFDMNLKNKQGKTFMDLALEQNNNDFTAAILMHLPQVSEPQKDKISANKLDIYALHQEDKKKMRSMMVQQSQESEEQGQQIEVLKESQIIMSEELLATQQQVLMLMQMNAVLMDRLASQEKLMALTLEHLGIRPFQAQETQRQSLSQVDNPNRLFTLENAQLNKVHVGQNPQVGKP